MTRFLDFIGFTALVVVGLALVGGIVAIFAETVGMIILGVALGLLILALVGGFAATIVDHLRNR